MATKTPAKPASKPVAKSESKHLIRATKPVVKSIAKPVKKALAKAKPTLKKIAKPVAAKAPAQKASVKTIAKVAAKQKPGAAKKIVTIKTSPKPPASKIAPKKLAATQKVIIKKEVAKAAKPSKTNGAKTKAKETSSSDRVLAQQFIRKPVANKDLKMTPFLTRQRQRLLDLKDTLLDSMTGVARGNLHAGSETSAFGMHQADAGSDAYDRDFALSMLSKEQGSLYEIDEALKRIEDGSYGVCEICEKPIRHDRLEALPFTRFTVECQAELEKRQHHHSVRPHINSLFGLTEEEAESEEEETTEAS